jgi:hypothetical protein
MDQCLVIHHVDDGGEGPRHTIHDGPFMTMAAGQELCIAGPLGYYEYRIVSVRHVVSVEQHALVIVVEDA